MRSKPPIFERFIIADCLYHQVLHDEGSPAFDQLKAEARDNNPWATMRLAELAIKGMAVYHNVEEHIEYGISMLLPLAKHGFAFAQYRLAEAYLLLDKDEQAINLLEQCLQAKLPDAAYRLSKLYENQKPKRAKKCRELADRWGYNKTDFVESFEGVGKSKSVDSTSTILPISTSSDHETFDTDYTQRGRESISWLKTNLVQKPQVRVYKSN